GSPAAPHLHHHHPPRRRRFPTRSRTPSAGHPITHPITQTQPDHDHQPLGRYPYKRKRPPFIPNPRELAGTHPQIPRHASRSATNPLPPPPYPNLRERSVRRGRRISLRASENRYARSLRFMTFQDTYAEVTLA